MSTAVEFLNKIDNDSAFTNQNKVDNSITIEKFDVPGNMDEENHNTANQESQVDTTEKLSYNNENQKESNCDTNDTFNNQNVFSENIVDNDVETNLNNEISNNFDNNIDNEQCFNEEEHLDSSAAPVVVDTENALLSSEDMLVDNIEPDPNHVVYEEQVSYDNTNDCLVEDHESAVCNETEANQDIMFLNENGEMMQLRDGEYYVDESGNVFEIDNNNEMYENETVTSPVDLEQINDNDVPICNDNDVPICEQIVVNEDMDHTDQMSSAPMAAVFDFPQDNRIFMRSPDYHENDPFLTSAINDNFPKSKSQTKETDPPYVPKKRRGKDTPKAPISKVPKIATKEKDNQKRIRYPTGPAGLPKMAFPVGPPEIFPFPNRCDSLEMRQCINKLAEMTKLALHKDGTVSGGMFVQKSLENNKNKSELALTMSHVRTNCRSKKQADDVMCNKGWRPVQPRMELKMKTNLHNILGPQQQKVVANINNNNNNNNNNVRSQLKNQQQNMVVGQGQKFAQVAQNKNVQPVLNTLPPTMPVHRIGFIARALDPYNDPPTPYPGSNPLQPIVIQSEGLPPAIRIDDPHSRVMTQNTVRQYKCNQCQYVTPSAMCHFRHWTQMHCPSKPFQCYYCLLQVNTLEALNKHISKDHAGCEKFYRILHEQEVLAVKRYNEIFPKDINPPVNWAGSSLLPPPQQNFPTVVRNGKNYVDPQSGKPMRVVHKYRVENLIACGLLSEAEAKLPPIQMSTILMQRLRTENGSLLLPPPPPNLQQIPIRQQHHHQKQQQPQQQQQQQQINIIPPVIQMVPKDTKDSDYESSSPQSDDKLKTSPNCSPTQTNNSVVPPPPTIAS